MMQVRVGDWCLKLSFAREDRNWEVLTSSKLLWVGNLPPDTTTEALLARVQAAVPTGKVESVGLLPAAPNGRVSAAVAFVRLHDAITARNHLLHDWSDAGAVVASFLVSEGRARARMPRDHDSSGTAASSSGGGGKGGGGGGGGDQQAVDALRREPREPREPRGGESRLEGGDGSPNVWVGGLEGGVTEEQLRLEFGAAGEVLRVALNAEQSCASVCYSRQAEGVAAMGLFHGAASALASGGGPLRLRFTRGANTIPSCTLWVGNVEHEAKDELVEAIHRLRRPSRLNMCQGKNYLFVDFDSIDDAITVREKIEGKAFGGKAIVVGFRNPPNQYQR